MRLDRDFDVRSLECKGHAALSSNFEAKRDGLLDIRHGFLARATLTHTARNRRALYDPCAIFILVDHGRELHVRHYITFHAVCRGVSDVEGVQFGSLAQPNGWYQFTAK